MKETPYTNREIKQMFDTQTNQIGELHKDVREVLEQTKKTNGRVGKLENWQSFMKGGLAILTILIVPILIFIINQQLK